MLPVWTLAICLLSGCAATDINPASSGPTSVPSPEPDAVSAIPVTTHKRQFEDLVEFAESFVKEAELEGAGLIVVTKADGIVLQRSFGSFESDRVSMVASVSKVLSAGVLVALADQGVLDFDAPVSTAVPWENPGADLSIAQLIGGTSGLVGLWPDPLHPPHECQWSDDDALRSCGQKILSSADGRVPPDSEFRYGGGSWQAAGAIAETVSGQTWHDLVESTYRHCDLSATGFNNIVAQGGDSDPTTGYPMGFEHNGRDRHQNPNVEAGASAPMGDIAKILLMHLRDGECENGQVFDPSSLELLHSDRLAEVGLELGTGWGYASGWWVERGTGVLSVAGAWGAMAWIVPSDDYGAYWITESNAPVPLDFSIDLQRHVREALATPS